MVGKTVINTELLQDSFSKSIFLVIKLLYWANLAVKPTSIMTSLEGGVKYNSMSKNALTQHRFLDIQRFVQTSFMLYFMEIISISTSH